MPIHLSREIAEEFFREEEEAARAQPPQPPPQQPSAAAQMEAAQNYQAALDREAESQRDLDMATNRWASAAFSGRNGVVGVRDQFMHQIQTTRAEIGRPFAEMRETWMRSTPGLTSFLRLANKEMRDNLMPVISEAYPEDSDEQIMAECFRKAMKGLGSDLPSIELPRDDGRRPKRKANETAEVEDVNMESHEQLRSDIEAIREGDKTSRQRVEFVENEVLMIGEQLRALPDTPQFGERRDGLLMRAAVLKDQMVEHVKHSREYSTTAKNVFDAIAMRWLTDMAVPIRVAKNATDKGCTHRLVVCSDMKRVCPPFDCIDVIRWEYVPSSVKQMLHRHGMEWCNTIVVNVFDDRTDSISKRLRNDHTLKSKRVEALALAMRPCDRRAGPKAPLSELRFGTFNRPESQTGYSYHVLHHGKKVEFNAQTHRAIERGHYTTETKRPYMLIWASLEDPEFCESV